MTWNLGRKRKRQYTGSDLIDEVVDRARNDTTWKRWNDFQRNASLMYLPSPDRLNHKDILQIREMNSWSKMMDTLENFLDPISDDGRFDFSHSASEMWEAFHDFNQSLSSWYIQKTGAERMKDAEKYAVAIGRIYQWGEWMIGLLFGPDGLIVPILPAQGVKPPDLSKEEIELGIEAGLFFVNKNGINWRRSQLVQRMQNQLRINTDEVRSMIEQIVQLFPETAPYLKPCLSSEMEG